MTVEKLICFDYYVCVSPVAAAANIIRQIGHGQLTARESIAGTIIGRR